MASYLDVSFGRGDTGPISGGWWHDGFWDGINEWYPDPTYPELTAIGLEWNQSIQLRCETASPWLAPPYHAIDSWVYKDQSFSSMSYYYQNIIHCEGNATTGRDSGWGARTTGTASQKYYGEFSYTPVSPIISDYIRVSVDVNHAAAADNGSGYSLFGFSCQPSSDEMLVLYRDWSWC